MLGDQQHGVYRPDRILRHDDQHVRGLQRRQRLNRYARVSDDHVARVSVVRRVWSVFGHELDGVYRSDRVLRHDHEHLRRL